MAEFIARGISEVILRDLTASDGEILQQVFDASRAENRFDHVSFITGHPTDWENAARIHSGGVSKNDPGGKGGRYCTKIALHISVTTVCVGLASVRMPFFDETPHGPRADRNGFLAALWVDHSYEDAPDLKAQLLEQTLAKSFANGAPYVATLVDPKKEPYLAFLRRHEFVDVSFYNSARAGNLQLVRSA